MGDDQDNIENYARALPVTTMLLVLLVIKTTLKNARWPPCQIWLSKFTLSNGIGAAYETLTSAMFIYRYNNNVISARELFNNELNKPLFHF